MSAPTGSKAIVYAFSANLGIGITKSVAAIITGSGSMIAEAIHSFADCINQVLLFIGMRSSQKPATKKNPLGHGKAMYFWSFIVAMLLFSMGGMFSLYQGIQKIQHPHEMKSPVIALVVLAVSIVLEAISLRGVMKEIKPFKKKDMSYFRWFRESKQSSLIVIFAEDLAALVGLVFAFLAVLTAYITQNPFYDSLGTVAIGSLLILVAVGLGIEVKSLLIGESASADEQKEIKSFITKQKTVKKVFNLITVEHGHELVVAVKAEMQTAKTSRKLVENINDVEAAMRKQFPRIRQIFFEPDIKD